MINEIFVKDFCNVTLLQEETFKKISPQGCNLQGWEKNTKPFFFFPLCIKEKLEEWPETIILKGIVGDVFAQIISIWFYSRPMHTLLP